MSRDDSFNLFKRRGRVKEMLRRDAAYAFSPPPHTCCQRLRARYWLSLTWTTLRAFDHAWLYSRKHLRVTDRIVVSIYSIYSLARRGCITRCKRGHNLTVEGVTVTLCARKREKFAVYLIYNLTHVCLQ